MRSSLFLLTLVGCSVSPDDTDVDTTAPGTQIGGIDCADSELLITVVNAGNVPMGAEVSWNPDGDEVFLTRSCDSPCSLEVYGGFIDYEVRVNAVGFQQGVGTVSLREEDVYATGGGECPDAVAQSEGTVAMGAVIGEGGGGDCLNDQISLAVLDAGGGDISAEVSWNPDGDGVFVSRMCNSPCYLDVYGGETDYTITAEVTGYAPVTTTLAMTIEDQIFAGAPGECPLPIYADQTSISLDVPAETHPDGCPEDHLILSIINTSGLEVDGNVVYSPQDNATVVTQWCETPCELPVSAGPRPYVFSTTTSIGGVDYSASAALWLNASDVHYDPNDTECGGTYRVSEGVLIVGPEVE